MKITQIPAIAEKTLLTIEVSDKSLDTDDLEVILVFLTSKVILKIEEIYPLMYFTV